MKRTAVQLSPMHVPMTPPPFHDGLPPLHGTEQLLSPVLGGRYQYIQDLLALEAVPTTPLVEGSQVRGILPLARWDLYLRSHPDKEFVGFLRRGIDRGFKIGFDRSVKLHSPKRNYESKPGHAQRYITEEIAARQLPSKAPVHWSSIGLTPKSHQPGKFRLIIDLSAPAGASVNDGISSSLTSLTYPRVDDAVDLIKAAGKGALMAKLDLKAAYRHVPVHPDDQSLLAIRWGGATYLDTALPFGSAPPQRYSQQWRMGFPGACCVRESLISSTT